DGSAQVRSEYRRRRDGLCQRLAGAGDRCRRSRPKESRKLGQGRSQRGLPLRLRQEVQALPRQVRLGTNSISLVVSPATTLVAGHRPPPMFCSACWTAVSAVAGAVTDHLATII